MAYTIKTHRASWGATFHDLYMDDRRVATLAIDGGMTPNEPRAPEIVWSAIGAQSPNVAKDFADGLLELVALAEASYSNNGESNSKKTNGSQP